MHIDCRSCAMYRSDHCQDCLVTVMLHPPGETVDLDEDLDTTLGTLSGAGLIPVLRFVPKEGLAPPAQPGEEEIA